MKTVFNDQQKEKAVAAARTVASGFYLNAGLSDSDVWGIIERGMAALAAGKDQPCANCDHLIYQSGNPAKWYHVATASAFCDLLKPGDHYATPKQQ